MRADYEILQEYSFKQAVPKERVSLGMDGLGNARIYRRSWSIEWTTLEHGLSRLAEMFPGTDGDFALDGDPAITPIQETGVGYVNISAKGSKRVPLE